MARLLCALLAFFAALPAAPAEPYRLRGDVFAAARSPVGLLILQGQDSSRPWLDAEAMVWTGGGDENNADALVVSMRIRDPHGRAEARVGRLVLATGAIRPLHLDGAVTRLRLSSRSAIEAFGGAPVAARLATRSFDWVTGTRLSHRRFGLGSVGLSFYHQHDNGDLFDEEVGIDLAATPTSWLDVASRAAYDLVSPGISDAHLSAAARRKHVRVELFASRRSPSRILPATSLFAVFGDIPSDELGVNMRWRAFPRLDLRATAAARAIGGSAGGALSAQATLRLDDDGAGAITVVARRQDAPSASWSGVRAATRLPLAAGLSTALEAELVIPDDGGDRGKVWPWALAALAWRSSRWQAATAIEVGSSPEHRAEINVLVRLARAWEITP